MNDELQKALATILNKTTKGVEAGVDFLQRELPDVIQQLLIWHGVKSGITFTAAIVLFAICIHWTVRGWKWSVKTEWEAGPIGLVAALPAMFLGFAALESIEWLQILLAPKLYLIEYAASLAK
jgi:hypothetical protein